MANGPSCPQCTLPSSSKPEGDQHLLQKPRQKLRFNIQTLRAPLHIQVRKENAWRALVTTQRSSQTMSQVRRFQVGGSAGNMGNEQVCYKPRRIPAGDQKTALTLNHTDGKYNFAAKNLIWRRHWKS